jgi:hypothetical protein
MAMTVGEYQPLAAGASTASPNGGELEPCGIPACLLAHCPSDEASLGGRLTVSIQKYSTRTDARFMPSVEHTAAGTDAAAISATVKGPSNLQNRSMRRIRAFMLLRAASSPSVMTTTQSRSTETRFTPAETFSIQAKTTVAAKSPSSAWALRGSSNMTQKRAHDAATATRWPMMEVRTMVRRLARSMKLPTGTVRAIAAALRVRA